jgi:hypothetical protein
VHHHYSLSIGPVSESCVHARECFLRGSSLCFWHHHEKSNRETKFVLCFYILVLFSLCTANGCARANNIKRRLSHVWVCRPIIRAGGRPRRASQLRTPTHMISLLLFWHCCHGDEEALFRRLARYRRAPAIQL